MEDRALTELARTYLEYYRTGDDALFWAYEKVNDECHKLDGGLPICLALIDASNTDEELAYVAAGPIEDLIRRVGPEAVLALDSPAAQSRKVRFALAGVWLNEEDPGYAEWHSLVLRYPVELM